MSEFISDGRAKNLCGDVDFDAVEPHVSCDHTGSGWCRTNDDCNVDG